MSPTSTNVDSLRNDMCEHVFDREDVSNTYKSNGYIEFYLEIYVSHFNKCRFFKK